MDDFPTKTSIYKGFSMAMLNNQRVTPMFRQGGGTAAAETRQCGECQAHADRLGRNERHSRGGISMAFGDFPWDFSWGFSGN